MPTRQAVMDALLTQIQTAGSAFGTYTRRWVAWIDDPQQETPNLPLLVAFESPDAEMVEYKGERGLPPIRTWSTRILIYGKIPVGETMGVKDSTTPGANVIDPLLDALETALAPDHDGVQTLGGLVIDCRIEGMVIKALGDADPSGICGAIVPIKILVQ